MRPRSVRAVIIVAAFCSLAASGPGASGQTEGATVKASDLRSTQTAKPDLETVGESKDDRYRIGYQDKLQIQVVRHPELNIVTSVDASGTVNIPRLERPVVAVCKTERELASEIEAAFAKDYLRNPQVYVTAIEQRSQAFAVIGAVEKPGSYFINRKVRLLELLAYAGGPSKEAGTRVIVARTGSTSNCKTDEDAAMDPDEMNLVSYKLDDVLEAKENLVMRPGDVVSVLKADVIYVYGNVKKQGQVPIRQPITLTQAIASAEGLLPAARKDIIRILRQKPGSMDREELVYNLKEIDTRKTEDPFLQPNDVVAVSLDKTKSIMNSIGKSLTQGIPNILYRVP